MIENDINSGRAIIEDNNIVIRVPIKNLQTVVDGTWLLDKIDCRIKVTDFTEFAEELCNILNSEDEQGTTLIHNAFDNAINEAWDSGACGIDMHDEQNE